MAAQLVTTIKRYIGTAAEIAAMTLTGIPTGSTFFESDTGILKVLNAAGALVTAPSESVSLSGSNPATGVVAIGFDMRGLAINKPAAASYKGYTYWSLDTDPHGASIEISDGTNWVVI